MQCLLALDLPEKAELYLANFRIDFSEHADSAFIANLEGDIKDKKEKLKKGKSGEAPTDPDSSSDSPNNNPSSTDYPICLDEAVDFEKSFCGHCNTTTDIKEASFFGR